MDRITILDCTLRDGGFINNWEFGSSLKLAALRAFSNASIEYVEVGYLRDGVSNNRDTTLYNHISAVDNYLEDFYDASKYTVMIDFGNYDLNQLPVNQTKNIAALRITFRKHQANDAVDYIRNVISLGYKVFINPVSIGDYSRQEIQDLLVKLSDLKAEGVAIVDTYGMLYPNEVAELVKTFDNILPNNFSIGLHFHNNLQQAFANIIIASNLHTSRNIIVDTSCLGMAKAAGNAFTEIVCEYLNNTFSKNYNIENLNEFIDTFMHPIKEKYSWGYEFCYNLSASCRVHPSYAKALINTKLHSVIEMREILSKIPRGVATIYSKSLLDELVLESYNPSGDVISKEIYFANFNPSGVCVVAPGMSFNADEVRRLAGDGKFIIALNFLPDDCDVDMVFVSNTKRASQLQAKLVSENKVTSLIGLSHSIANHLTNCKVMNASSFLAKDEEIKYNALIICLKWLHSISVREVSLLGLDGFSSENNYFNEEFDYKIQHKRVNFLISTELKPLKNKMDIIFNGETHYDI